MKPRRTVSCAEYDVLITNARTRELTDQEIDLFIDHSKTCKAGLHTVAGLEGAFGLQPGGFHGGDPRQGWASTRCFGDEIWNALERFAVSKGLKQFNRSLLDHYVPKLQSDTAQNIFDRNGDPEDES